jgi:hypothetical protein
MKARRVHTTTANARSCSSDLVIFRVLSVLLCGLLVFLSMITIASYNAQVSGMHRAIAAPPPVKNKTRSTLLFKDVLSSMVGITTFTTSE